MSEVNIDPRLTQGALLLGDLGLSRVLLVDNALFPWVILVPLRPQLTELLHLSQTERYQLVDEIAQVSEVMKSYFVPDKLNVATLGNQVSQLHIHVIARKITDIAWPHPVWGKGASSYQPDQLLLHAQTLRQLLGIS